MQFDPSVYLPQDRRHALASGAELPEHLVGAVLFADISGFTPLTEALVRTLGPQRGAEELTRQLNCVYDALIAEIDRYGGSVIGFSGDAITCWFAGDNGLRATASALALQGAMAPFATVALPSGGTVILALKASVAMGPVRRFVVGDPQVQRFDVLAGATLARMVAAERYTNRAEVVASSECHAALHGAALVVEWRGPTAEAGRPGSYLVVGGLMTPVAPAPWPLLPAHTLPSAVVRPWILPAIFERLSAGSGEPPADLRPATALFLRFGGIDYDADPQAGTMLDHYARWVQGILTRYEGTLLDLIIGDKGSYLYAVFGAPIAHEDDPRRAVSAALELRHPPTLLAAMDPPQIGISQGIMRAGAYGGSTRRAYAVLGDEVNVAARLMEAAAPGEILVSGHISEAVASQFACETLLPLQVKGKHAPVPACRVVGPRSLPAEPLRRDALLLGRDEELARLLCFAQQAIEGRFAGLAYVYGEAGSGKSHLMAELRRRLLAAQPVCWLTCLADPLLRQPLQPFRGMVQRRFGQDAARSEAENTASFARVFDSFAAACQQQPELAIALEAAQPLLRTLLGLPSGPALLSQGEPNQRLERMLEALATVIRIESLHQPVIVELEDIAWLDAESQAAVATLATLNADCPLAIVLTSRYRDDGSPVVLPLDAGVPQQVLQLGPLSRESVAALATQTLGTTADGELVELLLARTEGNPFFVEQLALDLRERGLLTTRWSPQAGVPPTTHEPMHETIIPLPGIAGLTREVPASITAVLIARIDRLPPPVKAVVQLAAVLGQDVDLRLLALLYGEGSPLLATVRQAEHEAIWWSAGDDRWRFHHVLLRDAAYGMQLREQLRVLHERAGSAIEQLYADSLQVHAADLAYHFMQAEDALRERRYLAMLGEQAFNISAFAEATAQFSRAFSLLPATPDPAVQAQQGQLASWIARGYFQQGDLVAAERYFLQSLALSEAGSDHAGIAEARYLLGMLAHRRADYGTAQAQLEQSLHAYRLAQNADGQGRALNLLAAVCIELGQAERALAYYEQALALLPPIR